MKAARHVRRTVKYTLPTRSGDIAVEVTSKDQMFLVGTEGQYLDMDGSCEITQDYAESLIEILTCGLEAMKEAEREFNQ